MEELIQDVGASAYRIPTDAPESDGTLEWNSTTLVLVEIGAAGMKGIGYTYGDAVVAAFINNTLKPAVLGQQPMDIAGSRAAIATLIRNDGQRGLAYMAMSAIDTALWDLKAKLLGLPLCRLLGMVRQQALIYGSGGFTSYTDDQLRKQLGAWAAEGITSVKMKIGRQPDKDPDRVRLAREAIGSATGLFVDANGAYSVRQALQLAEVFQQSHVSWFEEPVSADDLAGLHRIREHVPAAIQIAAGEYGYAPEYFLRMLQSGAVDVLQADATRCGGFTGMLSVGALCEAFQVPFSFHCAPALHLHMALCLPSFYIGEYFHDHVRIEQMLFDGVQKPLNGALYPDLSRPGLGLQFKKADAAKYLVG